MSIAVFFLTQAYIFGIHKICGQSYVCFSTNPLEDLKPVTNKLRSQIRPFSYMPFLENPAEAAVYISANLKCVTWSHFWNRPSPDQSISPVWCCTRRATKQTGLTGKWLCKKVAEEVVHSFIPTRSICFTNKMQPDACEAHTVFTVSQICIPVHVSQACVVVVTQT